MPPPSDKTVVFSEWILETVKAEAKARSISPTQLANALVHSLVSLVLSYSSKPRSDTFEKLRKAIKVYENELVGN